MTQIREPEHQKCDKPIGTGGLRCELIKLVDVDMYLHMHKCTVHSTQYIFVSPGYILCILSQSQDSSYSYRIYAPNGALLISMHGNEICNY